MRVAAHIANGRDAWANGLKTFFFLVLHGNTHTFGDLGPYCWEYFVRSVACGPKGECDVCGLCEDQPRERERERETYGQNLFSTVQPLHGRTFKTWQQCFRSLVVLMLRREETKGGLGSWTQHRYINIFTISSDIIQGSSIINRYASFFITRKKIYTIFILNYDHMSSKTAWMLFSRPNTKRLSPVQEFLMFY